MDLFGDTVAILNSLVSNSQGENNSMYLPPKHPIIAVSPKKSIETKKKNRQ